MYRGAIAIALAAFVLYKLMDTAISFGVYYHYKKHHPGECRLVKGLNYGSEDLEVTKDGLAFISSGIFFPTLSSTYRGFLNTNNVQGRIFLYDFNKPDMEARRLNLVPSKDFDPESFHPHGISVLEDEVKGEHLVYVVNHPDNGYDAVEKFKYLPKTNELLHLKSFQNDQFRITNDLALVEEDKFYITNYLYFRNAFLSFIEQILLPNGLGSLLYFDGTEATVVHSGLHAPNGLLMSKDKRYLYMNIPPYGAIYVYERKRNNSLVQLQNVPLHSWADNLQLSESGDALYTGAHPVPYKIIEHLGNPRLQTPSSVLRIPLKDGRVDPEGISELFYDHGDLISGSSSAAVYNRKLLIGSVINKLVICDVKVEII